MGHQWLSWSWLSTAPVAYPELLASTWKGASLIGKLRTGPSVAAFWRARKASYSVDDHTQGEEPETVERGG